ncbi:MAG: NAD(+)/NADH kinase [Treponema sp.]|jgi:NAD+ kinase|nr:NAD(+)/NADH kinase [Treponema sp.]
MGGDTGLRVLLFISSPFHKEKALALGEEIRTRLCARGMEVVVYSDTLPGGDFDAAFSLGGDGTVLYAARVAAPLGIPIFPVDVGTLGFIAAICPGDWEAVFEGWLGGKAGISRRLMLEIRVERQGEPVFRASCLNEAVVSASGIAKLIRLDVETMGPAAGSAIGTLRLGNFRADGLIVATPTGSTAYSMAAGGPIVDPGLQALIITPVCPFILPNRSILVPANDTVILNLAPKQRSGLLLTLDGQPAEPLEPGDRIIIQRAPYDALLIASSRRAFYQALDTKLFRFAGGHYA